MFVPALAWSALARPYLVSFRFRVLAALTLPLVVTVMWRPSTFLGLALAGVVYALLFVICLRVIRPLDGEDEGLLREVSAPLRAILQPFVARQRAALEEEAVTTVAP